VWIHAGELRIIPIVASTPLATKAPTVKEALAYIATDQQYLVKSPLIQEEAFYRIRKYPAAVSDQLHHSVIMIPRKLAYILHQRPEHVSPAIESFYLRDPISLEPILSSSRGNLRFPPDDVVQTSVRFTKVSFAQLKSQEFAPPDIWREFMSTLKASEVERATVGMKLTCGFEILLSDPQYKSKKAVREMEILLEDLESGNELLPSDVEIGSWPQLDDDEGWMNIDFNDFDRELSGRGKSEDVGDGFGDKSAQENLRKMVERFEEFLNNDDAGLEGAELDDSDETDEVTSDDEDEDKEVSFDEDEFARMMREMMGLPPEEDGRVSEPSLGSKMRETSDVHGNQEPDEEMRQVMERMEEELRESGVLNLDPTPRKLAASRPSAKGKEIASNISSREQSDGENGDEEVNIDFSLAKNMLEAFKSQGGASGPAGNLMGLMGVRMPPDKDEK
jgi:SGT1 protein